MTSEVDVSELRAYVSSLELVISSLVVTHHDKTLLASKLAEVALSLHPGGAQTAHGSPQASAANYDTVMSYARLAEDALGHDYQRADGHRTPRCCAAHLFRERVSKTDEALLTAVRLLVAADGSHRALQCAISSRCRPTVFGPQMPTASTTTRTKNQMNVNVGTSPLGRKYVAMIATQSEVEMRLTE